MSVLYVIERHDQLLQLWRSQRATGLRIMHLDSHCDMRGLLVDRQLQRAYQVKKCLRQEDEGNFLTHAIMEGCVQSVRWIHRIPGGRQYDVGTIKYTTDLTAQPFRWLFKLKGEQGIPINYEVVEFSKWTGFEANEFLDIDWDFFASKDYPINTIESSVEAFLKKDLDCLPQQISICYSSRYSHPSRKQFEMFVHRIVGMLNAEIVRLPVPDSTAQNLQPMDRGSILKRCYHWCRHQCRHIHHETTLRLRQRGIY